MLNILIYHDVQYGCMRYDATTGIRHKQNRMIKKGCGEVSTAFITIRIKTACKSVTSLSTLTRLADGFGSIDLTLPECLTNTRDSPH